MSIREIHEADGSFLVPLKHRVDSFRELSTARFVDATHVDPGILQASSTGKVTSLGDLFEASFGPCSIQISYILESDLISIPSVRQNGV